jgi:hypothetical protein
MIGHEITFTPIEMSMLFLHAGLATAIAQKHAAPRSQGFATIRNAVSTRAMPSGATTA